MTMPMDGKFLTSSFSNVDPVPFCVAVARQGDGSVVVKHSQDTASTKTLKFNALEWQAFVKGVKAGEFDL